MQKRNTVIAAMLILVFGMVLGCAGGRVVIGNSPPPPAGPPVYEKGPPPWAPAHGHRAKHHYRYYPSAYVYFDTGRGLYFYYQGGSWQVSVSLPTSIHIAVGDYVALEMDTDRPYTYHSDVVQRYPPGHTKNKDKGKGKKKW
jgi:hypothetical protein